MGTAAILLDVMQLVQAGLEFEAIVRKVQSMEATGATAEQVASYLKGLREAAKKALADELAKA